MRKVQTFFAKSSQQKNIILGCADHQIEDEIKKSVPLRYAFGILTADYFTASATSLVMAFMPPRPVVVKYQLAESK